MIEKIVVGIYGVVGLAVICYALWEIWQEDLRSL